MHHAGWQCVGVVLAGSASATTSERPEVSSEEDGADPMSCSESYRERCGNCELCFPMQFVERAIGSSCVKAFLTVILIASDFPDSDTDCFHPLDSDTDCFILFTP